jgi:hypothetical protein
MTRQHKRHTNKRHTYKRHTYKRRTNKRHTYKRRTNKRRTYKRHTYKRRTNRFRRLIPNSTVYIFNEPEKILVDTEHNKSGNIIPGLRKYLGNI